MEYWIVVIGLMVNGDYGLKILDEEYATREKCEQSVEHIFKEAPHKLGFLEHGTTLIVRCYSKPTPAPKPKEVKYDV